MATIRMMKKEKSLRVFLNKFRDHLNPREVVANPQMAIQVRGANGVLMKTKDQ